MSRNINTVIFDLDGTLIDTLDDLRDSVNRALEIYGYPPRTRADIRRFVGNGVGKLVERSLPEGTENETFQKVFKCFKEHYDKNCANKTKPYPGVKELLCALKKKGFKTAVVSNKYDDAVKELCGLYFGDSIDIAVGESAEVRKKPAPDSILKILGTLKTKKENAIFAGDSDVDIKTARNAGVKIISVLWGYRDGEELSAAGAEVLVREPGDILKMLE